MSIHFPAANGFKTAGMDNLYRRKFSDSEDILKYESNDTCKPYYNLTFSFLSKEICESI